MKEKKRFPLRNQLVVVFGLLIFIMGTVRGFFYLERCPYSNGKKDRNALA